MTERVNLLTTVKFLNTHLFTVRSQIIKELKVPYSQNVAERVKATVKFPNTNSFTVRG